MTNDAKTPDPTTATLAAEIYYHEHELKALNERLDALEAIALSRPTRSTIDWLLCAVSFCAGCAAAAILYKLTP